VTNPNLRATGAETSQRRNAARTIAASGRIDFWQSGSLLISQGPCWSEWQAHQAHQLALALEGEFRFRTETNGGWTVFEAAIVPSHCPHEFELDGVTVVHLFVEPESTEGRALRVASAGRQSRHCRKRQRARRPNACCRPSEAMPTRTR